MDIGKIPIIPPTPFVDTNIKDRENQATILQPNQTVQRAEELDSTSLAFREVTLQKLEETQQAEKLEAFDAGANDNPVRQIRREIERDRETSALIFKSIDVSTGVVVQQYPEEARLNLRAYLSGQEDARLEDQTAP